MKTVSLQTAKALKEVGFPQESYFWWVFRNREDGWELEDSKIEDYGFGGMAIEVEQYAAPAAEEILDRLPKELKGLNLELLIDISWQDKSEMWAVGYFEAPVKAVRVYPYTTIEETIAEAAAQMYIFLKRSKIL